jgi:hypothetical protein
MKRVLLASLLLCSAPALAGAAAPGPALAKAPTEAEKAAQRDQAERRMRTLRAVGLAEALELDEAGALKLDAQMKPFDERRRPLCDQNHADSDLLRKASEGDAAAQGQVDAAIARIFETRQKIEAINREMLETLSRGMTPQQKAKLAVFLATFKRDYEKTRDPHRS